MSDTLSVEVLDVRARYNWITVPMASKILGNGANIERLIQNGKLRARNVAAGPRSREWRIDPTSVEVYAVEAKRERTKEQAKKFMEEARRDREERQKVGVYIVRTGEGPLRYKIGYASDINRRVEGLRGMSPVRLELVAFIRGRTRQSESRLHRIFVRGRLHGEWFTESPALLWLCDKYRWRGEP